MRRVMPMLLLFSMLFASLDGAVDIAKAGHSHDDPAIQHAEVLHAAAGNLDGGSEGSDTFTPDHCEHCCHGHTSGLMSVAALPHSECPTAAHAPHADTSILNFAQTPPTPPPNA